MIVAVRTPPAAPPASVANPVTTKTPAPRRDRIQRLVAWATTALALSASIVGAVLILWTVIR